VEAGRPVLITSARNHGGLDPMTPPLQVGSKCCCGLGAYWEGRLHLKGDGNDFGLNHLKDVVTTCDIWKTARIIFLS
jgi:hypothetical protein